MSPGRIGHSRSMLVLRIAFGTLAALRATLVYGEAGRMQEPGWALARAERARSVLRPSSTLAPGAAPLGAEPAVR
jgi:hypothetical protein